MPLLDHFHPPLSLQRQWHSFHNSWATYLSAALNRLLPEGYFAAPNVQFSIEIDVATYDEGTRPVQETSSEWAPPAPTTTLPLALLTDIVEVQVFSTTAGPVLAGAIEFVSPANKDRAEKRDAFVSKCATFLQSGVGLVIVDVVTERRADMHALLLERLGQPGPPPTETGLYAVAYRPVRRDGESVMDIWHHALSVGHQLPTQSLWVRGGPCLPVELEPTYERTCQEQRVSLNGSRQ